MATTTLVPIRRRSAIEAAGHCLYRYQQIWVNGMEDMSDYARRGIAFHACAHRYILRLVARQVGSDQEEAEAAFLDGMATVELPGRLVGEVRQLYDRWTEHFELDLRWFLAAEERQERSEDAFTPDLVYARPDCLEIIDFKTFWTALTEEQAKQDFQAKWYLRNAMIEWPGFPQYRFTFVFVRLGTTVSIPYTPDMLDSLTREVAAIQAQIETAEQSGNWPATPGPACGYCTLKCPVVDNALIVPQRLLSAPQAAQLGGWILAADQMLKHAKKTLKQYCASHGPVDVKGMVWDNRSSIQRSYPLADAIQILGNALELEEEALADVTIGHSALAKLFKKFPALADDLASVAREKETWRFSAKKVGDESESSSMEET